MERVSPAGRCYSQWSVQCSTYWWNSACQQQSITAEFKAQIFRCSDFKTHFHVLRSTPVALPFMLYGSNLIHNSHSHHVCYNHCTSHNFLNHYTNVWGTLKINVLLLYSFFWVIPRRLIQTQRIHQKETIQHSKQCESLKPKIMYFSPYYFLLSDPNISLSILFSNTLYNLSFLCFRQQTAFGTEW